ncbi:DUF3043 domain-containing protein [Nocardioides sp. HM23]|uniref:DUF3043 domain-containing protein n=1 Tax=Nocardioides bizhenqiangii TaxID=3095076 RepID=UPI002ACA3333|nr:DUF3043 domain-containing protein [Nocardioides sp. HM23]MDZ5620737.1 DUF3043 domain-containing protein [Nocardioides sp. HM23]
MSVFRRTKSEAEVVDVVDPKPGGKGRPTPKRKEAEALAKARARTPRTRKEMAARARDVKSENSRTIREGMKSGDEKYLLPRDKGPMRRFIRDYVDSRFSIVELLIPLLVVTMILGYSGNPSMVQASYMVMMATFLFVFVDMVILRFRLRKELARRFPGESVKGTTYYAIIRSLQMKFMRMPKAQVKIGQDLPDTYR